MILWQPKDAADVRPYGIDWSPALVDGDTVATVVITTVCGTAVLSNQALDGNITTVTASGGVNGYATKFNAVLTTINGTVFRQVIWLPIVYAGCTEYQPSTTTKRTVVDMAAEDCGLPGYSLSATPEEIVSWIRRLDAMMREWPCGQALGYNFPTAIGASDPDDPTLVPDWALNAIVGKLAQKIAPGLGKTLSPAQQSASATAYSIMLGRLPIPEIIRPTTTPRGEGNTWLSPWLPFIARATCCEAQP